MYVCVVFLFFVFFWFFFWLFFVVVVCVCVCVVIGVGSFLFHCTLRHTMQVSCIAHLHTFKLRVVTCTCMYVCIVRVGVRDWLDT